MRFKENSKLILEQFTCSSRAFYKQGSDTCAEAITQDCERKKLRIDEKEAIVNARESEIGEKERKIRVVEERVETARLEAGEMALCVLNLEVAWALIFPNSIDN